MDSSLVFLESDSVRELLLALVGMSKRDAEANTPQVFWGLPELSQHLLLSFVFT